ncbi:UNKNOWN [Stylonychia lemnae]|uniref:Uncharacterized protein n=1 Tax=Stylonychia lemnae TaxID=5949 RepID=A0A078BDD6_STYLE|nr:UNKNOWN [Stylonychia lemnae]|eukprot:CDW91608.1 UNKNOWN [Stylonychia lemnae]
MGCGGSKQPSTIQPQKVDENGKIIQEGNTTNGDVMGLNAPISDIESNQLLFEGGSNQQTRVLNSVNQSHQNLKNYPKVDLSTAAFLQEIKGKNKFNWINVNNNTVNLLTAQFYFVYDQDQNIFRIKNDASRYTVSTLSWNYLEDYEVFEFKLKDVKYVDLKYKQEKLIEKPVEFQFDVSIEGLYKGMPEVETTLRETYPILGGNLQQSTDLEKQHVLKFLDDSLKQFWLGLVENQVTIGDPEENQTLKLDENVKISKEKFMDKIDIYRFSKIENQDTKKLIGHIQEKLINDQDYSKTFYEKLKPSSQVAFIPDIVQKDQILRQDLPNQGLNDIKFLKTQRNYSFNTQMMLESLRPILSQQTNMKKIVYTKDQKQIAIDIVYDSKLVLCHWNDLVGYDTKQFQIEMKQFRKFSFESLDKIKLELIEEKLVAAQ